MKYKELVQQYKKAKNERQKKMLIEAYFDTNPRARFWIYSFTIIIIFLVLGVGIGLFIRLIRFVAF